MGQELDVEARVRLGLRVVGWVGTTLWAGMCLTSGIVMGLVVGSDVAVALGAVGILPCLPFWISEVRRFRRRKTSGEPTDVALGWSQPQADAVRPARLHPSIRDEWRRLEQARDLMVGFAEDGWVERAALLHVDEHMARLERLLVADAQVEQLGGTQSLTLRRQVEELRALLVALADEAVEHQASLASDDPVPASLTEARERLATTTEAYRELQPPQPARNLQQPG